MLVLAADFPGWKGLMQRSNPLTCHFRESVHQRMECVAPEKSLDYEPLAVLGCLNPS